MTRGVTETVDITLAKPSINLFLATLRDPSKNRNNIFPEFIMKNKNEKIKKKNETEGEKKEKKKKKPPVQWASVSCAAHSFRFARLGGRNVPHTFVYYLVNIFARETFSLGIPPNQMISLIFITVKDTRATFRLYFSSVFARSRETFFFCFFFLRLF